MARKTITEDIFQQMKYDYINGCSIDDIVEKYKFKKNTIKLHFNKHGIYFAKRFSKEELDAIIFDYQNGMKPFELAMKYNRNSATIISKLQSINIYENSTYRFTDNDIEFLKIHYPVGNWETILSHFPNVSKQSIYEKMSELGIHISSHYWTIADEQLLIESYETMFGNLNDFVDLFDGRYTYKSIVSKARKLGLKTRTLWTNEEIEILKNNYSFKTLDEMMLLLPNRNRNSIISKAVSLGLINKIKLEYQFSDSDKNFIISNYNSMTDREIAMKLNRKSHSISDFRHKNRLLKRYEKSSYEDIADFIRRNNTDWKKKSMEHCNYCCILSKNRFDEIHHIYGFNLILSETFNRLGMQIKEDINDYSKEELTNILNCFRQIQAFYPLGACLTKDIHNLFHSIYGYGDNTEEQWNEFTNNYKQGKYNKILNVA